MVEKAILQFSGGKDSAALLYHMRDRLDGVEVCFTNTGAVVPEVTDFIERTCETLGVRLTTVRPPMPVDEFTRVHGLPSDLVPSWSERHFAWLSRDHPNQVFQSPMSCCGEMIWAPTRDYVLRSGAKLVYRGAKFVDKRRGVPPGFVDSDGIRYEAPLWGWSNADVMAFLAKNDVVLPKHYREFTDSFDCWCCTAHLTTDYGAKKIAHMKKEYPDLWPELRRRLTVVRQAVRDEARAIELAMAESV